MCENLAWAHEIAAGVARGLPDWFTEDDLIGPAEVALVQAAERYDALSGVPFRAYAWARVRGACIDSVRRNEYRERGHGEIPEAHPSAAPSPLASAESEQMQRVWVFVGQLGPMHALVVQAYYREGLLLSEIGRMMGVSESWACRLHREALSRLRALCEGMRP